jgi:predicted RNA binding protein YcfA (HicA-like mRNA interferase family)
LLNIQDKTMSAEKTLDKILRGDSDANIRFEELCHLLQAKGFRMRVSGSHHIFTQTGVMERINLQREGSKAKPYQVRQIRKILANYKLL